MEVFTHRLHQGEHEDRDRNHAVDGLKRRLALIADDRDLDAEPDQQGEADQERRRPRPGAPGPEPVKDEEGGRARAVSGERSRGR
jgi:hypothetical protein